MMERASNSNPKTSTLGGRGDRSLPVKNEPHSAFVLRSTISLTLKITLLDILIRLL